jgi:uncharacterized protein (DUF2132 family)
MKQPPSKDPLHGLTLETILRALVDRYGWDELGRWIDVRCFNFDPSISSSLKFLRKTPWARAKVERLYLDTDWEHDSDSADATDPPPS